MENRGEWKKFLLLTSFMAILFVLFIIIVRPKNETVETEVETKTFEIKDIGYGFIYYDGDVYYKNPNIIIYDLNKVTGPIGKNEKHIIRDDIEDNKIIFEDEALCIFAEKIDTEVYGYEDREDVLLIKSDYAVNSYFVYMKDKTPAEDEYNSLAYCKDNLASFDSVKLISYGMNILDIDINFDNLEKVTNNSISFSTSTIQQGRMVYYLLFEDDGIYYSFKGEGHLLSDMIVFESEEGSEAVQYQYTHEGLSDLLLIEYADFFNIKEE